MVAGGGPWRGGGDVFLCMLPIGFLLCETLRKNGLKSSQSLPLAAFMLYLVRTIYLKTPPNFANAACVAGFLDAITPLSIIAGAILLFQSMHYTKCLPWIIEQNKVLSGGHPVAEVMLIAWAFSYLVEGASGFGTPTALAAPMLAELGHDKVNTVVCCLIMNTLATPFGAVGTPIWFGFDGLGFDEDTLVKIGTKSCILTAVCAHIIPIVALRFLISTEDIRKNMIFIMLSIWACVVPALGLSLFSFEFSSILGGMVGLLVTLVLIKFKIGLSKEFHRMPTTVPSEDHVPEHGIAPYDVSGDVELGNGNGKHHNGNGAGGPSPPVEGDVPPPAPPAVNDEYVGVDPIAASGRSDVSQLDIGSSAHVGGLAPGADETSSGTSTDLEGEEDDGWEPMMARGSSGVGQGRDGSGRSYASYTSSGYGPGQHFSSRKERRRWRKRKVAHGLTVAPSFMNRANPESIQYIQPTLSTTGTSFGRSSTTPDLKEGGVSFDRTSQLGSGTMGGPVPLTLKEVAMRTFPLWGTVLLLVVTRVKQLEIKPQLLRKSPSGDVSLGTLGEFSISASLVVSFTEILGEPSIGWSYAVLYVPCILPFATISAISLWYFRDDLDEGVTAFSVLKKTLGRVAGITQALIGAMCLVNLLRKGTVGAVSPATLVGDTLSGALGNGWIAIAGLLGTLGSFFSGSTTVSNLTFGGVQLVAAKALDVSVSSLQALQCAGATNGNMVCINNIIAAKTVMGLENESEGMFIKKTAPVCLLFWAISTAVAAALWLH